MKQRTLAMMTGFERYKRKTRREIFLEEMEQVVPWRELCALVEPHYPKPGKGRPPVGVERMLRIYFLQQWFNLSDPAVEEALYDSAALRQFVGIDLGSEPAPDETTVCKFRHLWHLSRKLCLGMRFMRRPRNEIGTWHRAGGVQTRGIGQEIANDFPREKR
jgi:transposase, IS5 family